MNKILTAFVKGIALLCACVAVTAHAGEDLDAINSAVEQRAAEIDQKFGVLLTSQELNNLKISLIVSKVSKEQKDRSVKAKTDTAIKTYEITDPVEQRQLLIELEATSLTGNGGGDDP